MPAGGSDDKATLFAYDKNMTFPNDLLFGPQGQLFVSDSASGSLFIIEPDGNVRTWRRDSRKTTLLFRFSLPFIDTILNLLKQAKFLS